MEPKTFRATWSVGRRTMGWPLGLVLVSDSEIRFYSPHCSWWIKEQIASRDSIQAIKTLHTKPGVTRIIIPRENAGGIEVTPNGADADLLVKDLQLRGYVIDLSQ